MGPTHASQEILLVGLGDISNTHRTVLENIPQVATVAGVDPQHPTSVCFRGHQIPTYDTVADAAAHQNPDLVIIATPTDTHREVADQVSDLFPHADILLEKPAAATLTDAAHLLTVPPAPSLHVAYHMAFSPEVEWGLSIATQNAGTFGAPTAITATFSDPYESDICTARERFGSSWLDSGINALSILDRFVRPLERKSFRTLGPETGSTHEGRFLCHHEAGTTMALIVTTWHVTAPAKTTRIKYASGAELILDHTAVAGYLFDNAEITAIFGTDGHTPRRYAHYQNMYRSWLVAKTPMWSTEDSWRLHQLLLN